MWPVGLGFEYFYGFLGGDSDQWHPALFENTRPIEPYLGKPDYIFDRDMADKAIAWMRTQHALAPNKSGCKLHRIASRLPVASVANGIFLGVDLLSICSLSSRAITPANDLSARGVGGKRFRRTPPTCSIARTKARQLAHPQTWVAMTSAFAVSSAPAASIASSTLEG